MPLAFTQKDFLVITRIKILVEGGPLIKRDPLKGSFTLCIFYDCDSSYRNKWVVQDSMEVFTLCDSDNITNSYTAHYK